MSGTMDPMATDVDQQELAQQLPAQAREQGIDLVGPDGLLNRLTENVLETALEAEMDEHLGYEKHDVSGRGSGNSRTPLFTHLMDQLKMNRSGPSRPRTRPDRVRGDKAYLSNAIRTLLRDRGITAVIPQPTDQIGHRKRRGSTGERPPVFDGEDYKGAASSNGTPTSSTVAGPGNPLRQTRPHLSRRSRAPGNQHLADSFRKHARAVKLCRSGGDTD